MAFAVLNQKKLFNDLSWKRQYNVIVVKDNSFWNLLKHI